MRYLTFLTAMLLLSASGNAAVAQTAYTHWDVAIRAYNAQMSDSLAAFGVRADATSDFDSQYDIPRPPRSPSGTYLEVYFPHSGGAYPPVLGTRYATDFQSPADPVWSLSVEASAAGPVTVRWDSSAVNAIEPRVQLFLHDLSTGAIVNMRTVGTYAFNYTARRDFQILGAVTVNLKYLMEGFWNGSTQIHDTVTGFLTQSPLYAMLDSASVVLSDSGTGFLAFPNAASGSYSLVIRHRNHLELWSSSAVALVKGTTSFTRYDFSFAAGQAYGSGAMKQEGSVFVAWGGDVNQDGVVDYIDRNLTWNNRTLPGYLSTDCNGDGATDGSDYSIVLANRLLARQRP